MTPTSIRPVATSLLLKSKRGFASVGKSENTVDTLIIGGGPMGLSTAYHLALRHHGDNVNSNDKNNSNGSSCSITIVERDPTYARSSATLSAGGIRQQFSLKENVQMSLYGRDFLRQAHHLLKVHDDDNEIIDVQFQEHGYLFLASSQKGKEQLIRNHEVQLSATAGGYCGGNGNDSNDGNGANIRLMDPSQLKRKFPWLNTSDIALGSYGESGEGWFDPWALMRGLKRKCQSMGVTFVKGYPVGAVRCYDESSSSSSSSGSGGNGRVLSVDVAVDENEKGQAGEVIRYNVDHVVNAAGAHCSRVMETLASGTTENGTKNRHRHHSRHLIHPIPVEPRKRSVFFIHCNTDQHHQSSSSSSSSSSSLLPNDNDDVIVVPRIAPLTVCPITGVYFRSEGSIPTAAASEEEEDDDDGRPPPTGNFLCGVSPPREIDRAIDDVSELDYADYELWDDVIWPALYHRVPAFGEVKVKSSWAGLYECK
mmetsp:Transcript_11128/g.18022  ORF Transcript_11128/g.18022 Transcript_11128/m.18022 type:complete len:481 (+) Transcript_11128:271-1713(+)